MKHNQIKVTQNIIIEDHELIETFIRSPGCGGQKVNKTESAVQLRFDARQSDAISHEVFQRLKIKAGRRMTQDGVIVITANTLRTQEQNRKDALDRLVKMIADAAVKPKKRRPTKPTKASKKRRLDNKNKRSDIKKKRGKVQLD